MDENSIEVGTVNLRLGNVMRENSKCVIVGPLFLHGTTDEIHAFAEEIHFKAYALEKEQMARQLAGQSECPITTEAA